MRDARRSLGGGNPLPVSLFSTFFPQSDGRDARRLARSVAAGGGFGYSTDNR